MPDYAKFLTEAPISAGNIEQPAYGNNKKNNNNFKYDDVRTTNFCASIPTTNSINTWITCKI